MIDFGGKLRLAREQRGISIAEIGARTKISRAALESLERNDVSKLPGGIVSRAFVRAYAREVGLDPDETVAEFLARFEVSAPPAVSPVVSNAGRSSEIPQRIATVGLPIVLAGLPLIGLIWYVALRTPPARDVETRAAASETVPATSESPAIRPVATSAVSTPAVTVAPDTMTLEVHPTAACWVKVTADGRPVLARLMNAGDRETRQFRNNALIQIGDAGAFAFSIDGRIGKSLGDSGEVRTVRVTRETLGRYVQQP